MSYVTAAAVGDELVPLRTDFDVVLRGYERGQVQRYVQSVETDLRLLATDRDAAIARSEDLARELDALRAENARLRQRVDRISRAPIAPDALPERLRRMAELAHEEAAEITARAQAAAEEMADRLRLRAEQLDRRAAAMDAEHREVMRSAQAEIDTMTERAEERRQRLDDEAAALRKQAAADAETAAAARRAETARAIAEQEEAARRRADELVRDATKEAERIVGAARRQADVLREHRDRLAAELRDVGELLADVEPLLVPLPEEVAAAEERTERIPVPREVREPVAV